MEFESPLLLLALLPVVALGLLLVSRGRYRVESAAEVFHGLSPRRGWHRARLLLAGTFLLSLAVAAARPYLSYSDSGRYLFVVDVSRSMQARFSCSEPTFLERARAVLRDTIEALPQAEFGIIAFDRFAFPVTHMTRDRAYLADVIEHGLYVGLMLEATQTEIANALAVVADKTARLPEAFGGVGHVILVTDGHVGGAWERRLREPLGRLSEAGIRVSTVGIGNPEPTPIADSDDGQCIGQPIEVNGERVLVPLRTDILRFVATETSGSYYTERETDRLVRALSGEFEPVSGAAGGAGRAKRDVGAVFVGIAAIAMLGFIYLPASFPLHRD